MYLLIYVDDVIITGDCAKLQDEVKSQLKSHLEMSDLGECKFVLGIELVKFPSTGAVTLCERRYVDDILKRFGMDEYASSMQLRSIMVHFGPNRPERRHSQPSRVPAL